MNTRQIELWDRIQAYPIDDPSSPHPFTARLARENSWTRSHARRVTDEYKRFVLLCLTAGHPCTPSLAVDEAWHLHLIHTRSYWDDFCGGVLGQPLHHDPTRGGAEEDAKFRDWYGRTLESYRACFGAEPPPDIWVRPARSEEPDSCRTSSTAPNPASAPRRTWITGLRWTATTALAAAATGMLWWQSGPAPANSQAGTVFRAGIPWADYLPVVIAVVVVGSAIKFLSGLGKRHRGGGSCGSGGGGCTSDSTSHSSHGGSGNDGGCGDGGGDGGGGCDGGGSGCGGGGCGGGGGD